MTWDSRAYRIPIIAGVVLFTPWTAQALGEQPVWHVGNGGTYLLAILTLAGTLFTWWARIHLGRFWSSAITRKQGHRVIDTGPYAIVRHPLYAGLSSDIGTGSRALIPVARHGGDRLWPLAEAGMEEAF
jgi:protein-S-isoprenylcysteine O-methyltransferase Ste14